VGRAGRLESLRNRYSQDARSYRELWAPYLRRIGGTLLPSLPLGEAERVLDLGCGVGTLLSDLVAAAPGALVVGADASEGMLRLARRDVPRVLADAVRPPFADGTFDVVVMAFMLFHLSDPAEGLKSVRRLLRPGGTIGVLTWGTERTSPALEAWTELLDTRGAPESNLPPPRHDLMDSTDKATRLLEASGFQDVSSRSAWFDDHPDRPEFLRRRVELSDSKRRLDGLGARKREAFLEEGRRLVEGLPAEAFLQQEEVILTLARAPD
jgi:SAM-dependent methyltransferase